MGLRFFSLFSFPSLKVLSLWVSLHHYFVCSCALTLEVVTQELAVLGGQDRTQWSQRIVFTGEGKGK